ncbi:MAG: hypothetical protein E6H08_12610 [Bacteroidetes bacterium]|nr:MAG: hypothetical protein E6H08_12610 [Bacteroidota bacterium]
MKTLLPLLKTKLFLLSFISACTVILATTIPQVRNFVSPEKLIGEKITTEQKKIAAKISKKNKTIIASRVTSSVSLEMNNSFTATLTSDAPDYAPLSTATFTGAGFAPNEDVVLKVKNLFQACNTVSGDSSYIPWTVTADDNGAFLTTWTVCNCPGDSLRLRAVGQTSHDTAYLYFSDAGVVVTTSASGGNTISADNAGNATSPAYTTLGNIVISETATGDIKKNQSNSTFLINAPAGWSFNTAVTPSISFAAGQDISAISIAVTSASVITVTYSTPNGGGDDALDVITIGATTGIQIRANDGGNLTAANLTLSDGTGNTIQGLNTLPPCGPLQLVIGAFSQMVVTLPGQTFTDNNAKATSGNSGTASSQIAGTAFNIGIRATDQFFNVRTDFTGTANITSTGTLTAGTGPTASFVSGVLSSHSVTIFPAAASITITATRTSGGAQTGTSISFAVNNPVPTISTISPTTKCAGDIGFTLTVNGSNFNTSSIVRFNGSDRTTTFVNSGQLTASISGADIVSSGNKLITVFNPTPGGGTTPSATLTVQAISATPVITSPICEGSTSVSGTSTEANGTVIDVLKNGVSQGTATVTSNAWTKTGLTLSSGDVITTTATASGKCISALSSSVTVQAVSATPVINSPICAGSTSVSGTSTEADGTIITVFKGGVSQGTTTVSSGTWTKTALTLATGNVITASAQATGECVSALSSSVTVQAVSATPVINSPICEGSTSVSGTSTEATGTIIDVLKNGVSQGTTTVSAGTWTKTSLALASGDVITATATASGKCISATSSSVTVQTVSTIPVINSPICAGSTSVSGTSTEADGTIITVFKGGVSQGTTTVSSGSWTKIALTLATGNVITATAQATGECVSAVSSSVTVQAVSATPVITSPICEGSTSVSGTSTEANGTVIDVLKNGVSQGTTTVSAGTWTKTSLTLASGDIITATATASGKCISATSSSVTVNPTPATPTISAGGSTTICNGGSVLLTSSSTTGNQWYKDAVLIGGATNQTFSATTAGTYTVVVTTSGCSSAPSAGTAVTVNPRPTGTITGTQTICTGSSATLSIAVTGTGPWSGTLSNGQSFSGSSSPISVVVTPSSSPTTFTIATLSDANCSSQAGDRTGSATVTLRPLPTGTVTITGANPICSGSTTTIKFTGPSMGSLIYKINGGADISDDFNNGGNLNLTTAIYTCKRSLS